MTTRLMVQNVLPVQRLMQGAIQDYIISTRTASTTLTPYTLNHVTHTP